MKLHNFSLGNTLVDINKVSSCLLDLDLQLSHVAYFLYMNYIGFLYMNYIVLAPEQLSLESRIWCQWSIQFSNTL